MGIIRRELLIAKMGEAAADAYLVEEAKQRAIDEAEQRREQRRVDQRQPPTLTPVSEQATLRDSQRHRERCRAIAAMSWQRDSTTTIADMIRCDDMITHGCEGKIYGDQTLRDWVKDLAPAAKPGRPKKTTATAGK